MKKHLLLEDLIKFPYCTKRVVENGNKSKFLMMDLINLKTLLKKKETL